MKRKLLPALTGALLTAAPFLAQAQLTTTLFGNANAQFENVKATGSVTATGAPSPGTDKPSRWRLSNVSSDLGVKASMPLGSSGFTGMAQYVTGVNVDSSNASTAGGLWASAKDVFVGISRPEVGTLKLGRLTGAARWASGTPDFSPAGAGPQDDQMALAGFSGQASPAFNVRIDNAVGFESASFGGFTVRAYYGANEGKSNSTVAPSLNDTVTSLGASYVIGPVDLRASFEQRNDKGTLNASTANDTKDRDMRLGVRYTLPTSTVLALAYDSMKLSDNTATGTAKRSLDRKGWVLGARHPFGAHAVYGGFGKAGNLSGVLANGTAFNGNQTGAKQLVLAYTYNFNKEFLFETYFSQVANEKRAKYDFDSGGISPGTGAKLTALGAGLRYSF